MGRHRLRKKDRIKVAGKGNNHAQYVSGKPKEKWLRITAARKERKA